MTYRVQALEYFKHLWRKFVKYFTSKVNFDLKNTQSVSDLKKLDHNCGPVALAKVMPELSYEQIEEAFYNCCDTWPQGGVTNREFNIVLRYLDIFKNFKYIDNDKKIQSVIKKCKKPMILLIPGHFTVLYRNKIYDGYGYNIHPNTKIYCVWIKN